MTSIPSDTTAVIGGIDTHQDLHMAALVDPTGRVLGTDAFSTTRAGYRALLGWFRSKGEVIRVGVESTGSYGAGITRHLALAGIPVLEVTSPDLTVRRRHGKDDSIDAVAAAHAALWGRRVQVAKDRSGAVESLRTLRTTRRSAVKARRATLQLLHNTIVAAPDEVRDQVRNLTRMRRLRLCATWRPDMIGYRDPVTAAKIALKSLGRRILLLNDEIAELDLLIGPLVQELAPALLALPCVGVESAGEFLVTAGDNPARLRSEASFAMLCGASPIPASSGKTTRHRLNRGGHRQANSALHMGRRLVCGSTTVQNAMSRAGFTRASRRRKPCAASSDMWPARSFGSWSTRPLDKYDSVQGSQFTSAGLRRCSRPRRWPSVWTARDAGSITCSSNASGGASSMRMSISMRTRPPRRSEPDSLTISLSTTAGGVIVPLAAVRRMWSTSKPPSAARQPETLRRFHLSRCPDFRVHFSTAGRPIRCTRCTATSCFARSIASLSCGAKSGRRCAVRFSASVRGRTWKSSRGTCGPIMCICSWGCPRTCLRVA